MITAGERIHVIGIAGSGAAGAAILLQRAGAQVDGCDADGPSPYTPPLEAAGIRWQVGHDPAHLSGVDRVAITPALRALPHHAELAAAEAAGIPVVTWQALLGELMAAPGRIGVGVTGTHGKSTTTALLGHLLAAAGLDPTVEVGAFIPAWGASVRPGAGRPFVVEADEFGDNFLNYHPAARDRHERRDGPPRLLRRRVGRHGLVRAVRARHGAAIRPSGGCCSPRPVTRVPRSSSRGSATGTAGSFATVPVARLPRPT